MHGTMRCCGREIFRRLYFILYIKISCSCNRCVSNVCQLSLLCMCVTPVVVVMYYRSGGSSMYFFQGVDIILCLMGCMFLLHILISVLLA